MVKIWIIVNFSTEFEKNYKYEKHSFKKDKTRPCNKGSIIQLLLIEDFKDIWACPWSFSCLCNKGTDVCSHKFLKAHTCTVHSRCYSTSSTCPSLQLYGTFPCTYLHNTLPIQNSIIYTLLTQKKKNRKVVNTLTWFPHWRFREGAAQEKNKDKKECKKLLLHCFQYVFVFVWKVYIGVRSAAQLEYSRKELRLWWVGLEQLWSEVGVYPSNIWPVCCMVNCCLCSKLDLQNLIEQTL